MGKIGLFLADEQPIMRRSVALVIDEEADDIEVVGEASNAAEALENIQELQPDVVLMNIGTSGSFGLDTIKQILEVTPGLSVLVFTSEEHENCMIQAFEAGVKGIVPKTTSVEDLLHAIRMVFGGNVVISSRMATWLVEDCLEWRRNGGYAKLSPRERDLLPMVAEERTPKEIAQTFGISQNTVQTYRQRIMKKLDLHSQSALLKYALRKGLIRLEA